jgi:hypothetical protein
MTTQRAVAKSANGIWVLRGKVTDIVERERTAVNNSTGVTEHRLQWRELTLKGKTREPDTVTGDVVYGASLGDDIALVIDPRGREPLCLANISTGKIVVHGSADPNAQAGKGVIAVAILMAVVGAIPGFIAFYMMVGLLISPFYHEHLEGLFNQLAKVFPFILLPLCWYASNRLDQNLRARAKRVYGEIQAALRAEGVVIDAMPIAA